MKKFKTPIAVRCYSREDVNKLAKELVLLSYKLEYNQPKFSNENEYFCTNSMGQSDLICCYGHIDAKSRGRIQLDYKTDSLECILALAAMVDNDILYKGEWIYDLYNDTIEISDGSMDGSDMTKRKKYRKASLVEIQKHFNKQTMKKEIIGYKAPFDMINGKTKKGDIYKYNGCGWYHNNGTGHSIEPGSGAIPKEIVETWEPVYKEDKKLPKINNYEGVYKDGVITYGSNCAKFSKLFFEELYNTFNPVSDGITNRTIGAVVLTTGVTITKADVEQIIDYLKDKE